MTPLHFASLKGQAGVAQLLLEHGAVVNAQDQTGRTPLHSASQNGFLGVLLRHGGDVHLRESGGWTPFQMATMKRHDEVVQLLVEHDAERRGGLGNHTTAMPPFVFM